MDNGKKIELSIEKQTKFWSAPVDHYKASVTGHCLYKIVQKFVGSKVLDVGAADGSLMRILREKHSALEKVVGIDLAPKNQEVVQGSCTAMPFQSGQFDTVFATDVLEHLAVDDFKKCLLEIGRVLKKGGFAIFATPNEEDLEPNVVHCPHCDGKFHRWGHCQSFSADSLRKIAEQYGFKVSQISTTNLGLLAQRPLLSRIIYALGIYRIYKTRTFLSDLVMVVEKV